MRACRCWSQQDAILDCSSTWRRAMSLAWSTGHEWSSRPPSPQNASLRTRAAQLDLPMGVMTIRYLLAHQWHTLFIDTNAYVNTVCWVAPFARHFCHHLPTFRQPVSGPGLVVEVQQVGSEQWTVTEFLKQGEHAVVGPSSRFYVSGRYASSYWHLADPLKTPRILSCKRI